MGRFGLWGRFPMSFGGGKPLAQRIYEDMRDGRGEGRYSKDDDADVNVDLQAAARQIAIAAAEQERAGLQAFPGAALDLLEDWERALGRVPDPSELLSERQAMLDAILAGNGEPTASNIALALETALDGEPVYVVAARARARSFGPPLPGGPLTLLEMVGGRLAAGEHAFSIAFEDIAGTIYPVDVVTKITLTKGESAILVNAVPLGAGPPGTARVHVYMSVASGSDARALVATTSGGSALVTGYPEPPATAPLHHLGIIARPAIVLDPVKRAKIDEVLGPMLSAWTTYDVITSSPFVLGTDKKAGASELGLGGF